MHIQTDTVHGTAAATGADLEGDTLWYKDAVIYELHIKAYADGNGDGIGDFRGLTERLDHVQSLGVNTVWLLPFYPSPQRDDGYDVSDYENVHPSYGTLDDFRAFVIEAHRRNLRVITELVVNHTSDQHPWFQAARNAPKDSPERNFYVWSDDPKKYSGTRIIFTDTEKSNWTWDEVAQQYFWHRFFSHQPDLNFDNPAVLQAVLDTMEFWLEMGVDGFRLDAIPYLIERDGTSNENLRETHDVIKEIRRRLEAKYPGRLLLAEANMWPEDVREYFGDGDECQMAYHFPLMPRLYMAIAQEDRHPVVEILAQTPDIPANCQCLLSKLLLFAPKLLVALLVTVFGSYFARFVGTTVESYCRGAAISDGELLGRIARYAVLAFVLLLAIDHLDISGGLIQQTFLILLGGLVFAAALAFGLGARRHATALLDRWFPQDRADRNS